MKNVNLLLKYLDERIEKHNERIGQAVKTGNHDMKTICKAERAEADTIRAVLLRLYEKKEDS